MKPYLQNLTRLFCVLLFMLCGCNTQPGIWKNEKIEPEKRNEFHDRNNHALELMKSGSFKLLTLMMSKNLRENHYAEKVAGRIGNFLNDHQYHLHGEYYCVNNHPGDNDIKITNEGINNREFQFNVDEKETYFAFYLPENIANQDIITLVFSKFGYGWKLSDISIEPYRINGKTGPELFESAKAAYHKGFLIDAVNDAALANTCINPANFWHYACDADLKSFYSKTGKMADDQYPTPLMIDLLPTRPRIVGVFLKTTEKGAFPLVYYLSSVKLEDTTAIKKENKQLRKAIDKVMPGLNQDKKFVYYAAFNQMPSSEKEVDRFDMIDTLR
ncbi:MAG TPA: hypothetical protein VHA56_04930 [Mucilaginibacter sp.]|nr:hypothetical protein [Mucilaginibacter sp.]